MQIYVCVKHVPDSAAALTFVDNSRIDENVTFLLNPYDEHAVTEAVRIRDLVPGSEAVAVCLGNEDAEKTVRSALAMGADRGLLVTGGEGCDSIATARALKAAIERDGSPSLIFTGRQSIDAEGWQTMFRLGALFGFPAVTNAVKLELENDKVVVESELAGGVSNIYEMHMPCVIGAGRRLNTPGYPTFPDIVRSKKKIVEKIRLSGLETAKTSSCVTTVELAPMMQARNPSEIKGNPAEAARKIADILKNEAKVI
jgi:electron transfer flavoprotein beta subunit